MTAPLQTPEYDRTALRPRILHLGFGAFARAHILLCLDRALSASGAGNADWGTVVARLNSGADALSDLDTADHLYTVIEVDNDTTTARQIGVITGTCHPARDGADALPDLIASPALAIVTLTITEKGYCLTGGAFDPDHPALRADLARPHTPTTAIGVIVEGLRRRHAADAGGLSILSCDNLPSNGRLCRAAILGFAALLDPDLARWIEDTCRFPATMVDRIVPALDDSGRRLLRDTLGQDDPNGIVCEPFLQWVIEDDFAAGRPDWDKGGAQLTADVAPFEDMKLRMLNGSHSFLAYLGALSGHATVDACMGDPALRAAARRLMVDEAAPTLSMPDDIDLAAYGDSLLARFANRNLRHKTTQIAMDGSQKLPQRMLATIRWRLDHGLPFPALALGVAGWMGYIRAASTDRPELPISDPLAQTLRDAAAGPDGAPYVKSLLTLATIFPEDLAANPAFTAPITDAYLALRRDGAAAAVRALKSTEAPA